MVFCLQIAFCYTAMPAFYVESKMSSCAALFFWLDFCIEKKTWPDKIEVENQKDLAMQMHQSGSFLDK